MKSGPVKSGHVGTENTSLLNESHFVTGIDYIHSITCITKVDKFCTTCENS